MSGGDMVKGRVLSSAAVLFIAAVAPAAAAQCLPGTAYKERASQAFQVFRQARSSLVADIRLANHMNSAPSSVGFARWNAADARAADDVSALSKLARLEGTYNDALSCHTATDAAALQPYLYALTDLAIAGNLLYQARSELITKCDSTLAHYMPYFKAADQAVGLARHVAAGKVKSTFASDFIAQEPDELANMREIPNRCGD